MVWWEAYALTLVVEAAVLAGGLAWLGLLRPLGWRFPVVLVLANLTHPVLWALPISTWQRLVAAEAAIAVVEGALWWAAVARYVRARRVPAVAAGLVAVAANLASLAAGLLC